MVSIYRKQMFQAAEVGDAAPVFQTVTQNRLIFLLCSALSLRRQLHPQTVRAAAMSAPTVPRIAEFVGSSSPKESTRTAAALQQSLAHARSAAVLPTTRLTRRVCGNARSA